MCSWDLFTEQKTRHHLKLTLRVVVVVVEVRETGCVVVLTGYISNYL
jgi:hypothetical protein